MNTFRRIFGLKDDYKHDEDALLERFMRVDVNLMVIAERLEGFDARRHPYECTGLLTQLRRHQSTILNIFLYLCGQFLMEEERPSRDFRIKFSDDVLNDLLPGQLWFGAECLAGGSSIPDREVESDTMRPIAVQLLETIEALRASMRARYKEVSGEREWADLEDAEVSHDVSNMRISDAEARLIRRPNFVELLKQLDATLAYFEFCYVSAVTPVKTMRQVDRMQEVVVVFAEALSNALRVGLVRRDAVDFCDPALMFTIPRLGIVRGLLLGRIFAAQGADGPLAWGPVDPDSSSHSMCDMFATYRKLLSKIKRLLMRLSNEQLTTLQRQLCDVPSVSTPERASESDPDAEVDADGDDAETDSAMPMEPVSNVLDAFDRRSSVGTSSSNTASEESASERRRRHGVSMSSRSAPKSNHKLTRKVRRMLVETAEEELSAKRVSEQPNAATLHKLFVCIAGIADILQTTHASDMRYVLRTVFTICASEDGDTPSASEPPATPRRNETACEETPSVDVEVADDALAYSWDAARARPPPSEPESVVSTPRRAPPPPTVPVVIYHTARPVWVPDERVRVCLICASPFNIMRRRHHCRNCGNIFCGTCSSKRLVLKSASRLPSAKRVAEQTTRRNDTDINESDAVRVCDRCFHTLTTGDSPPTSMEAESLRSRPS